VLVIEVDLEIVIAAMPTIIIDIVEALDLRVVKFPISVVALRSIPREPIRSDDGAVGLFLEAHTCEQMNTVKTSSNSIEEDLIEQRLRGQDGGFFRLKREVRDLITTVEQGNARPIEEVDIIKRPADIDARRPEQLASNDIEIRG